MVQNIKIFLIGKWSLIAVFSSVVRTYLGIPLPHSEDIYDVMRVAAISIAARRPGCPRISLWVQRVL